MFGSPRDATHRLEQCGEIVTNAFEYQRPSSHRSLGAVPARSPVQSGSKKQLRVTICRMAHVFLLRAADNHSDGYQTRKKGES
jgi:hypothetical protein